jgi:O-methyltransferase involved in polyketide biosynthesis
MPEDQKDYTSISPSAKSLLLMKGYTNIPYAKETAALLQGPEVFDLSFDEKDFWFWIRVMHFENRYWTIDQLLKQTDAKNILELSSGYSFRGLDLCVKDKSIHYIDTDLPEVVAVKQDLINKLKLDQQVQGNFELLPLNALDENDFDAVVSRFEEGPLTIVNEGLLMYLGVEEKKRLCKIIHNALGKRGGCWITADIYVKRTADMRANLPQSRSESAFFEKHNIEENKFENYEAAEAFFKSEGFELVKEATPDYGQLSVMPHLLKVLPEEARNRKEPPPKIQATWMLKPIIHP